MTVSNNSVSGLATPVTPQPAVAPSSLSNQDVFIQLLVAQLKNQDPQNPADGTQFVTELAQFTTLQETTQSAHDISAILKILQSLPVTPPPTVPAK